MRMICQLARVLSGLQITRDGVESSNQRDRKHHPHQESPTDNQPCRREMMDCDTRSREDKAISKEDASLGPLFLPPCLIPVPAGWGLATKLTQEVKRSHTLLPLPTVCFKQVPDGDGRRFFSNLRSDTD